MYTLRLAGTDQYYGRRSNGQPHWTTQEDAKEFESLKIARGLARLLRDLHVQTTIRVAKSSIDPAALFQKYRRLALFAALRIGGKNTRYRFELMEEAESYLAVLVCSLDQENYNLQLMKLDTMIASGVRWHLLSHLRNCILRHYRECAQTQDPPARRSWLSKQLVDLSASAREVVELILFDPKRLGHSPELQRSRLQSCLQAERRWSPEKIEIVWEELEECFG